MGLYESLSALIARVEDSADAEFRHMVRVVLADLHEELLAIRNHVGMEAPAVSPPVPDSGTVTATVGDAGGNVTLQE